MTDNNIMRQVNPAIIDLTTNYYVMEESSEWARFNLAVLGYIKTKMDFKNVIASTNPHNHDLAQPKKSENKQTEITNKASYEKEAEREQTIKNIYDDKVNATNKVDTETAEQNVDQQEEDSINVGSTKTKQAEDDKDDADDMDDSQDEIIYMSDEDEDDDEEEEEKEEEDEEEEEDESMNDEESSKQYTDYEQEEDIKALPPRKILRRRREKREKKVEVTEDDDAELNWASISDEDHDEEEKAEEIIFGNEDHETPGGDIKQYDDGDMDEEEVKFNESNGNNLNSLNNNNQNRVHFDDDAIHLRAMEIAARNAQRRHALGYQTYPYPATDPYINNINNNDHSSYTYFNVDLINIRPGSTKWVQVGNEYGHYHVRDGDQEIAFQERGYKEVTTKTPHPSHDPELVKYAPNRGQRGNNNQNNQNSQNNNNSNSRQRSNGSNNNQNHNNNRQQQQQQHPQPHQPHYKLTKYVPLKNNNSNNSQQMYRPNQQQQRYQQNNQQQNYNLQNQQQRFSQQNQQQNYSQNQQQRYPQNQMQQRQQQQQRQQRQQQQQQSQPQQVQYQRQGFQAAQQVQFRAPTPSVTQIGGQLMYNNYVPNTGSVQNQVSVQNYQAMAARNVYPQGFNAQQLLQSVQRQQSVGNVARQQSVGLTVQPVQYQYYRR